MVDSGRTLLGEGSRNPTPLALSVSNIRPKKDPPLEKEVAFLHNVLVPLPPFGTFPSQSGFLVGFNIVTNCCKSFPVKNATQDLLLDHY